MASDAVAAAGRRLAADFRQLRADRGLTLEDLHEETKIPRSLLEQFEETALFDHAMFNRVYLRSFVRTYAEVAGLPIEEAMTALEEAMDARYQGGLLGVGAGEGPGEGAGEGPGETPPAATEQPAAPVPPTAPVPPAAPEGDPEPPAPVAPTKQQPSSAPRQAPPEEPPTDWASLSPPPGTGRVGRRPQRVGVPGWVWFVGVAVLLGVGIWGLLRLAGGGDAPDRPAAGRTPAAADTASAPPDTAAAPPRPAVVLGDTMHVTVIAARDKVDPLRVTRDDDVRRPYWIEQGEARVFPATQRIVIEEKLDAIRVLIENVEYPTSRRDAQGRIVITRAVAQAFLDSTSRGQITVQAPVDTLPKGPIRSQ